MSGFSCSNFLAICSNNSACVPMRLVMTDRVTTSAGAAACVAAGASVAAGCVGACVGAWVGATACGVGVAGLAQADKARMMIKLSKAVILFMVCIYFPCWNARYQIF